MLSSGACDEAGLGSHHIKSHKIKEWIRTIREVEPNEQSDTGTIWDVPIKAWGNITRKLRLKICKVIISLCCVMDWRPVHLLNRDHWTQKPAPNGPRKERAGKENGWMDHHPLLDGETCVIMHLLQCACVCLWAKYLKNYWVDLKEIQPIDFWSQISSRWPTKLIHFTFPLEHTHNQKLGCPVKI